MQPLVILHLTATKLFQSLAAQAYRLGGSTVSVEERLGSGQRVILCIFEMPKYNWSRDISAAFLLTEIVKTSKMYEHF